jgi:hypothetical protein
MPKRTPLLMYLPYNKWTVDELSKFISREELELAIACGDVPRKNVPGYDYQQMNRLDLERRFSIIKELELESEIDVTLKFLNGHVNKVIGVVTIERRQPSPGLDPRDPLAAHQPDLVVAIKKRLDAGDRPGSNEEWDQYCHKIREDCGKTATEKVTGRTTDWGYGDRTIQNITRELLKQYKRQGQ